MPVMVVTLSLLVSPFYLILNVFRQLAPITKRVFGPPPPNLKNNNYVVDILLYKNCLIQYVAEVICYKFPFPPVKSVIYFMMYTCQNVDRVLLCYSFLNLHISPHRHYNILSQAFVLDILTNC